jgi:alginate O-acetyltransferase complex protein AlgJ
MMSTQRFRIFAMSIVFTVILLFPLFNGIFKLVKDIKSSENRRLASLPNPDVYHPDDFPGEYEQYYNDHFTIRSLLVKYYDFIKVRLFKISPNPDQVIIGQDDWLFKGGNEIDAFQGNHPFELSELEAFRLELEFRQKYLEAQNCKFYFLITPVKACIYPEKVPSNLTHLEKQSWGEQLIHYLNYHSKLKPIDIYNTFKTVGKKELIYYKLDTHWNRLGAFYAANIILARIHSDFPKVSVLSLENYNIIKTETAKGNILKMISNIDGFRDSVYELTPRSGYLAQDVSKNYNVEKGFPFPDEYEKDKEIQGADKPSMLIISDSYGSFLFPFLSEQFKRSVKIFDSWQYKLNASIVKKEKPDIVLLVISEAYLRNFLKYRPNQKTKN